MSDEPSKGKIHVDSDWKAEAEEEKQRLAEEEAAAGDKPKGPLPDPTLADLVNVVAMPAAMAIGGYRTPDGQTMPPDLALAKYHIDMLGLLEEKTKGNLSAEESQMIGTVLHQLRMHFTEVVGGGGVAPPPEPQG